MAHWEVSDVHITNNWWDDGGWWITSLLALVAAASSMWVVWRSYRDRPRVEWKFDQDTRSESTTVHLWNIGDATAIRVEPTSSHAELTVDGLDKSKPFFPRVEPGEHLVFLVSYIAADYSRVSVEVPYLTSPVRHRKWQTLTLNLQTTTFTVHGWHDRRS